MKEKKKSRVVGWSFEKMEEVESNEEMRDTDEMVHWESIDPKLFGCCATVQQMMVGAYPDAILPRDRRAPVHWGLNGGKSVGGPFGSDSRYTANMVAEQPVKNR